MGRMTSTIRLVDDQGRVALPSEWRSKRLRGKKREVVLVEVDDALVIRPRDKVDLTQFFDSIDVDVDPKAFKDYKLLKKALLPKKQ